MDTCTTSNDQHAVETLHRVRVAQINLRLGAVLIMTLLMLVAAGCSITSETVLGSDASETTSSRGIEPVDDGRDGAGETDPGITSSDAESPARKDDPTGAAEPTVDAFESSGPRPIAGVAMHPNGAQVALETIEVTRDATILSGQIVNGRSGSVTIDFDDPSETYLVAADGRRSVLLEGARSALDQGSGATFEIAFEPIAADVTSVDIHLGVRGDDSLDLRELRPGFFVGGVDVTGSVPVPALPAGVLLGDIAVHPAGLTVHAQGIGFSETHIGVAVEGTNGATFRRALSDGLNPSYLEDDLGNRYWLQPGPERRVLVESGTEVAGTLVFAGRIDPQASSLTLVLNREGSVSDPDEQRPRFEMGPWALDGSFEPTPTETIAPLTVNDTQIHANGASFTVSDLEFAETGTTVGLTIITSDRAQVFLNPCCDATYLLDDRGNRYLLRASEDDRGMRIPRGEGIEGRFSFPGTIDPAATSLTLVIGDRGEAGARTDDSTSFPELDLGPWPLTREAGTAPELVAPSNFGTTTSVGFGAVQESESSGLDLVFSEFDGIEIPGGVQLTLPTGILFGSGESRLQPGAGETIDKIVQIFDFYEGDQVTVVGHTDSEGSEEFNQVLSEARADEVRSALIRAGAPASLVGIEGAGELEPVADNGTEAGRQANRRVEIRIMTDKGLPS